MSEEEGERQEICLYMKKFSHWSIVHISKKGLMTDLSCIALLLFAFFPIFTALFGRWVNYIRYVAVLGFFLGVMKRDIKLFSRMSIILSLGFIFSICYYLRLWRLYCTFPAFMAKSMLCWIYSCFALYYSKFSDMHRRKTMRTIWMLTLIITSITTVISLMQNPLATRVLANATNYYDTAQTTALYLRNTASWGIMFGMSFALPMWIAEFKIKRSPQCVAVIIAITISVVASQITYAIIFATVFLVCIFLRKLNLKKLIIAITLTLLFILFFQDVVAGMLNAIYEHLDNSTLNVLKTRVYQLYFIFGKGQLQGDADARMTLYTKSLITFLRNPLLGQKVLRADNNIIGMHSQIFDLMGTTGLLGLLIYSGTFIYIIKKILPKIKNVQIKTFFIISILMLVLLMIVNPTWYAPETYMSVFFLPFLMDFEKE